jgi:hypothetical protein
MSWCLVGSEMCIRDRKQAIGFKTEDQLVALGNSVL